MCEVCGGMMGDPFENIAIKKGYFSLEHFGGSRTKWRRIITFKYDQAKEKWFLSRVGDVSYDDYGKEESTQIATSKDFGTVDFEDYNANIE